MPRKIRPKDKELRKEESDSIFRMVVMEKLSIDEISLRTGHNSARIANIVSNRLRQMGPIEILDPELAPASAAARAMKAMDAMEPKLAEGDPQAVRAYLAGNDQLIRLAGAYKPSKAEYTGKDGGPIETKDVTDATEIAKRAAVVLHLLKPPADD